MPLVIVYGTKRYWSTPTRVGNAYTPGIAAWGSPVHPHTRGECARAAASLLRAGGPPPHAWGMPKSLRRSVRWRRSTPTRVGNATPTPTLSSFYEVHPHTRGECGPRTFNRLSATGPPPHAWGMHSVPQREIQQRRSTPTRVGNAARRACTPATRSGPPPHAWGMQLCVNYVDHMSRSTPTRVGNACRRETPSREARSTPTRVGNARSTSVATLLFTGPPPHAWGMPLPSATTLPPL